MRRLHNDIPYRNRIKLQGKLISWFCSFFLLCCKRWTLVLFSIQYVSQQMGLIKYNTNHTTQFMISISPTCFGTGLTFSGSLRTRNVRCDWQNTSYSCSSRIHFFPFPSRNWPFSFVACSCKRTDCRCVRTSAASDVHALFLIAGRGILLAAEINCCGCEGFGLSVAFL